MATTLTSTGVTFNDSSTLTTKTASLIVEMLMVFGILLIALLEQEREQVMVQQRDSFH